MKTRIIIEKLEKLFGKDDAQKNKDKQLETVIQLIDLLETKEKKFRNRISEVKIQFDQAKCQRKLSLTEKHLAKARAYKQTLES